MMAEFHLTAVVSGCVRDCSLSHSNRPKQNCLFVIINSYGATDDYRKDLPYFAFPFQNVPYKIKTPFSIKSDIYIGLFVSVLSQCWQN